MAESAEKNSEGKMDKVPLEEMSREDLLAQTKRQIQFLQKFKVKHDELKNKYKNLDKEHNSTVDKLARVLNENDVNSVEQLQSKIESLQRFSQEKETDVRLREEESVQLRKELEHARKEKQTLSQYCENMTEQLQCTTMKLETLEETCKYFQAEQTKLNGANKELKDEVHILVTARDAAVQSFKVAKEEWLSDKKALSLTYEQKVDQLQNENRNIMLANEEVKQLKELSNQLKEQNGKLSEKIDELSQRSDDYATLQQSMKELMQRYKDLELTKEAIENEKGNTIETFRNEIIVVTQAMDELKSKILSNAMEFENEKQALMKDKEVEIEKWRNRDSNETKQRHDLKEQVVKLEKEVDTLTSKLKEDGIELQSLRLANAESCNVAEETLKLEKQLSKLTSEMHELQRNSCADAERAKKEFEKQLSDLENEKTDLVKEKNMEIENLRNEISESKRELDVMTENLENKALKNTVLDLEKQVDQLKAKVAKDAIKMESDRLANEDSVKHLLKMSSDIDALQQNNIIKHRIWKGAEKAIREFVAEKFSDSKAKVNLCDGVPFLINAYRAMEGNLSSCDAVNKELEQQVVNLTEKLESASKQCDLLHAENTELEEKHDREHIKMVEEYMTMKENLIKAIKDIDMYKQQLDEYENDIQKHLNLERENCQLHNCLKELERENFELNEKYVEKSEECNEANSHVMALIASVQQAMQHVDVNVSVQLEDDLLRNVFILRSLCEDMDTLLSDQLDAISSLRLQSLNVGDDLPKEVVQDAKDEAISEELLTGSPKESEVFVATPSDMAESIPFNEIVYQISQERGGDIPFPMISEWGYVEEDASPMQAMPNISSSDSILVASGNDPKDALHSNADSIGAEMLDSAAESKEARGESKDSMGLLGNLTKSKDEDQHTMLSQESRMKLNSLVDFSRDLFEELEDLRDFKSQLASNVSVTNSVLSDINQSYSVCFASFSHFKKEYAKAKDEMSSITSFLNELMLEIHSMLKSICADEQFGEVNADNCVIQSTSELLRNPSAILEVETFKSELALKISKLNQASSLLLAHYSKQHQSLKEVLRAKEAKILELESLVSEISCQNQPDEGTMVPASVEKCVSCEELEKKLHESDIKMGKFKTVAAKFKKELVELRQEQKKLLDEKTRHEDEMTEITKRLDNTSSGHSQYVQNFQCLQNENDRLQDEAESFKATNKSLQSDLSVTLEDLNKHREKLINAEANLENARKDLTSVEADRTALKKKIIELEGRVVMLEAKNADDQNKVRELTKELTKSQKECEKLTVDGQDLKAMLDDAQKEKKQHSLLNLEMADYERTVEELTVQIEKQNATISDLQNDIEGHIKKVQALQEEIKFCESHRETEEKRAESFKATLEGTKKELLSAREHEASLIINVAALEMKVETLGQAEEGYKSQLSKLTAEMERLKEMLKSSSENHQRIASSLNSKIAVQKEEIVFAHAEIERVKQDFESYKTRVHSVLKQQKSCVQPFSSADAEARESLEAQNDKLKLQIKDLSEKLQALTLESESVRDEYDHLLLRHNRIVEELEAKNRNWSQRLEEVNSEKSKLQLSLEDAAASHALRCDLLTSTYKKQIKILQEEHKTVVKDLEKQLVSADIEIAHLQKQKVVSGFPPSSNVVTTPEEAAFDITSQERQEGEGSECTEDRNTPVRHLSLTAVPTAGFMPLEKLLQSPVDVESSPYLRQGSFSMDKLSSELSASLKKLEHLTELLNESEASNLRYVDQVRILKEEVRRLERNKQREEHAENLEYLKNVFIKFATLQPGSEKATLIPVLSTMLKLSPTELQQLKLVAGESDPAESASSGWGSYLHHWSGIM